MINGQKVWTSLAQYSDRCVLLTRTGPADSRHRGITAFFVDMDTPGITVAPLEMINGEREFAEVFFDDVVVPADRMLGELNGGWAVAMSILPYERSSCFWQRIAYLYRRLQKLVDVAPDDDRAAEVVGNAFLQLHALRARSRATQHRLAAGPRSARRRRSTRCSWRPRSRRSMTRFGGSSTGIVEMDDSVAGELWRSEYLYSRSATIYGGTAGGAAQHHRPPAARARERRMIDAADRAAMEESVRAAIAGADGNAAVDEVLGKLGWLEMLAAEPADAIEIVFGALGASNGAATALDDVVASALGEQPRADLAVLLPHFAAWDPPGRIESDELHARGLATARAATAGEMLVVCGTASEPWLVTVPMRDAEVRAVHGIDPDGGFHAVRVQGRATAATRLDLGAWQSAIALGRRAVAHQIAGASRAMLELARTHALERVQFDRPIAGSRRCATDSRTRWWRWRRSRRRSALPERSRTPTRRPSRRPLRDARRAPWPRTASRCSPASASPRSTVPPIPEADAGARGTLRVGGRDRPGCRKAAARRAQRSDADRALRSGRRGRRWNRSQRAASRKR